MHVHVLSCSATPEIALWHEPSREDTVLASTARDMVGDVRRVLDADHIVRLIRHRWVADALARSHKVAFNEHALDVQQIINSHAQILELVKFEQVCDAYMAELANSAADAAQLRQVVPKPEAAEAANALIARSTGAAATMSLHCESLASGCTPQVKLRSAQTQH
jgi:hypothetical protein